MPIMIAPEGSDKASGYGFDCLPEEARILTTFGWRAPASGEKVNLYFDLLMERQTAERED